MDNSLIGKHGTAKSKYNIAGLWTGRVTRETEDLIAIKPDGVDSEVICIKKSFKENNCQTELK